MADVTSAPVASPETAPTAQSQPTSTQDTAPQSASTSTPAAPKGSEQPSSKPNLFESEEFRKYQSQQEKRIAQERQRYQMEMAQLRQQMQQVQLQSAPEEERIAIERDQLRQQLSQFQQEQQRQAQLAQQWQDVSKLASYAEMKPEELFAQNFSNIGDAAFYVLENMTAKQKRDFEKSVEAEIEKRAKLKENNTVDLGGGAPVTTEDIKSRKLGEAIKKKDAKSFVLQYLNKE